MYISYRSKFSKDVTVTSFYFLYKLCVYFMKKVYCMNFRTVNDGKDIPE